MKRIVLFLLLISAGLWAQDSDTEAVRQTIERFFKGFHQRDSSLIKETVGQEVILQTIVPSGDGDFTVRTEPFGEFLKAITTIPDTVAFKELLLDYRIQVDGPMAQVWTPYEFWLNEEFSHCGVDSYQLVRQEGQWKIIYLIDTRRKENCP